MLNKMLKAERCYVLVTEKFVLFIFVFIFASNIGRENESVLFSIQTLSE